MNNTMLTDFYEFTMMNGFFENGCAHKTAYFDMFFRRVPDKGGFAVMAGVEQVIQYIRDLEFTGDDIEFLRSKGIFCDEFLDYLKNFKFECDVWAIPEGTPIFPYEPVVVVRGPAVQAQFLETMILLTINHQSLIATKANRIVRAADGRSVMEFGSRRAQGYTGAVEGARAAYIAGVVGTACAAADEKYGVPALGTMAHSWVQMFDSEYEAFKAYAKAYPHSTTLLIDTYNVLRSGLPNAIRVFDEVLKPMGARPAGVRIDSGDITYLSKKCRRMLDEAGYPDCKIVASNSLDEYIIRDMLIQGAKIDTFGVGERLITASSEPVFGGVYKLAAVEDEDGNIIPKIKISENVAKITTPGFKQVYRLYSRETSQAMADIVTLHNEVIDDAEPYEMFDPEHIWKRKTVSDFYARPLLKRIFKKGELVYENPPLDVLREYCKMEIEGLWEEVKRFENPHAYYVDLSEKLWRMKNDMLSEYEKMKAKA
ncbi:MAG TPA: nicotinate phosphoribosyltransferase [Candidatus Ornithomonoglobus intestinigallinarum]|uniref:Nicotinate phosphoribosyltransferase n=1 Tax=Candidatus Ornithomonoglobus intestinigallinarum TaxID=2840894 RepID=A0A9D1H679_9FIRM|nr:nicotinate phosphoribosyltransferase [Candidatus Ornithomonoglobus intestinigallinarum]